MRATSYSNLRTFVGGSGFTESVDGGARSVVIVTSKGETVNNTRVGVRFVLLVKVESMSLRSQKAHCTPTLLLLYTAIAAASRQTALHTAVAQDKPMVQLVED
jgi:hypothetical protein